MMIRVRFHVRSFPRLFPRSVFKEGHQCGDCKIRTESRQSTALHVRADVQHRAGELSVNSRSVQTVSGDHERAFVVVRVVVRGGGKGGEGERKIERDVLLLHLLRLRLCLLHQTLGGKKRDDWNNRFVRSDSPPGWS